MTTPLIIQFSSLELALRVLSACCCCPCSCSCCCSCSLVVVSIFGNYFQFSLYLASGLGDSRCCREVSDMLNLFNLHVKKEGGRYNAQSKLPWLVRCLRMCRISCQGVRGGGGHCLKYRFNKRFACLELVFVAFHRLMGHKLAILKLGSLSPASLHPLSGRHYANCFPYCHIRPFLAKRK